MKCVHKREHYLDVRFSLLLEAKLFVVKVNATRLDGTES